MGGRVWDLLKKIGMWWTREQVRANLGWHNLWLPCCVRITQKVWTYVLEYSQAAPNGLLDV